MLDLDETLVHSSLEDAVGVPDFSFTVSFNGRDHAVQVGRPPGAAQPCEDGSEMTLLSRAAPGALVCTKPGKTEMVSLRLVHRDAGQTCCSTRNCLVCGCEGRTCSLPWADWSCDLVRPPHMWCPRAGA